jgi:predicted alpha/beta-hydrolase family hydrolase
MAVRPDLAVSWVRSRPQAYVADQGTALILAHGAGNDMDHPFLVYVQEALAHRGLLTARFNFPYKKAGRRAPDPPALLEATWSAVIERVRGDPELRPARLFLGGKSMGGRMASHIVATGTPAHGLVFLGYPLHPAGAPERLRVEHLGRISCPMLFVQGSRDPLCHLDLLQRVLDGLSAPVDLHVIQDGAHSFQLPKSRGRSTDDVWDEIVETVGQWIAVRSPQGRSTSG